MSKKTILSHYTVAMAGALIALLPVTVFAQTASQITPPSYAPPAQAELRAPLTLPAEAMRTPPEGANTLFVTPQGLTIEGGKLSPATEAQLRQRLDGKRVSVAEIFAAAGEAEMAEAKAGRVLLRVSVPQQDLKDGAPVRLAVVEGFIERVDTSGLPANVRSRIARLAEQLTEDKALTLRDLERRLMLAADVPGVTVRSTLSPGERPGGTVLRLEGEWQPVSGFVSLDNTLSSALGSLTYGAGVNLNSVLGAGEQIYLRASGLPNTGHRTSVLDPTPRNRALAAGLVVPLGDDGLTLTLEGTDARTAPRPASATSPGFGSRFQRFSSTLRYPVVRRRDVSVGASLGFDAQNERVRIIDPVVLPLSQDRLRVVRLGADASAYLPGQGFVSAQVEASLGVTGLGARSASQATVAVPLSRAATDADFRKLTASFNLTQPLAPNLAVGLRARGQTSFGQVMANAEQFGIASVDGISPLDAGRVQGDSGFFARGELKAPFVAAASGILANITPYAFAAQGTVWFKQPTVFERRRTDAFAYGAGMRVAGQARDGSPGVTASLEYGRAHLEGLRPDRLTFSVLTRF
ncbi:ShlB/FhaC/HecB family hemolysin secretion/activation protein [Sphingomonas sp. 2378]|uniref:ShlB/FhaC/HecB family hemolysin secretion/activation protein n=1 Tax=Sphingomonas sp. 2378 TaxID=1219748 RepID=UPI00311B247F